MATSLAKGARALGVTVATGVSVTGLRKQGRRVVGVETSSGYVECETVVLAAGLWTRELARAAGVDVPLQAAEHYYLITEPFEGVHRDQPVVEDPDRYGYFREEGGGLLVGLFEPTGAPWSLDGAPKDFSFGRIPPDWDRMTPFLEKAMERYPVLDGVGISTFFCGPESFTPDVHPFFGPAPEADGVFVAAGLNSLGILLGGGAGKVVAQWIVDGRPPVDVTHYSIERAGSFETTRRFRSERTVESLGVLFGDGAWPTFQWRSGRGVRRSALHDVWADAGARFMQSSGWEIPLWFGEGEPAEPQRTWGRSESFEPWAQEHRAVREAVGVFDMTFMSRFLVQGRDAAAVLDRLSANFVGGEVGRVVYTQWCDVDGGILADVTVTRLAEDRFMVGAADLLHRRVETMLRTEPRDGEVCIATDVTAGVTLLSIQGPQSRALLASCGPDDWSDEAFGYLTAREMEIGYNRVLVARVTYVGELGYELYIPTDEVASVWETLSAAGEIKPVGILALNSLRLEKGYRDYGLDIENTDNPIVAGLQFAIAWDKPGGFTGRDALLAVREDRSARMVHVLLEDPEPVLHGGEPLLHNGSWVGYVRAGSYGHTLGGSVGLAVAEHDAGVTSDWLAAGGFTVEVAGTPYPAKVSLRAFYDPERLRVRG